MALFHTNVLDPQIKALPTVDTASGAIASFNTDLTENLVSVKCQIVAKQASGTPSPDNPLPITTHNSMSVFHNSINQWDEQCEVGLLSVSTGLPVSGTGIRSKKFCKCKPNTAYYMVCVSGSYIFWYDENQSFISAQFMSDSRSVTSPLNGKYFKIRLDGTTTYSSNISVNYPSTDTTYHAFNGAYIPFNQTVGNGVLDITTGKLRVTHGFKTFNGSESWNKHGSIASWFYVDNAITDGYKNSTQEEFQICNCGIQTKYDSVISLTNGHFAFGSANNRFVFKNTDYTEVADFKTWLNNNNMQVAYKLATPIEIQLDSINLQALLNENNIWCDTGDTEVKYLLTVGKKIS